MSERWVPAPGFEEEFANDSRPTPASEVFRKGYAPSTEEDTKTRWGDYARSFGTGALGVASAIPTLSEYATQGEVGGDTRRYLEGKSEDLMRGMTPVAKRAMGAAILPGEGQESIFDVGAGSSLGLQGTAALPSLIASIIPAGMAARIAKGASAAQKAAIAGGAARGSAAVINAGDVTQQIFSNLDDMSDEDLMKSSAFRGYVNSGMEPSEARKRFYTDVAGVTPFLAGGISALLASPEAELASNLAGAGAAKKGLLKGALSTGLGEAREEAVESGTGEFITQQRLAEFNLGDRDWQKVLSQTVQGGVLGFGMGAGAGGVTNIGHIAPDQQKALEQQTGSSPDQQITVQVQPNSGIVPEKPETLQSQQDALVKGDRAAMLFPTSSEDAEFNLPEGMQRLEIPDGIIHYNPEQVSENDILELAKTGRINELLGYLQSKDEALIESDGQPVTAVTRDINGNEVDAAAVSPDRAQEQLDILKQRAPAGSTGQIENPQDVINSRMSAQVPADIAQAMQPTTPSKLGIGPAGQAILNQNKTPLPADIANTIPTQRAPINDEADAWEAFDNWGAENTPDVIRYDDGRTEEVMSAPLRKRSGSPKEGWMTPATEQALRRREAAVATPVSEEPSEQEYWDAYNDYKNELTPDEAEAVRKAAQDALDEMEAQKAAQKEAKPSDGVTVEAAPVAGAKGRRARRTAEQIAADKETKAAEKIEKAAAKKAAKAEKARVALETAEKRAAEKAARSKAPAKAKSKKPDTAVATTKPPGEAEAPSGVIDDVYINLAKRLADKKRVSAEGSHESNVDKAKRATKKKVAEEEFFNPEHQPGENAAYAGAKQADLLRGDTTPKDTLFIRSDKQRAALKARLQKFVKAIETRSGPINPNVTKNSSNYELYARVAKDVLKYIDNNTKRSQQSLDDFIADEMAARKGDFGPMRKRRLEEGDQESRPNNELNEETNSGATASIGAQSFPAPDEIDDVIAEQRKTDYMNAYREILARKIKENSPIDSNEIKEELAKDYPDVKIESRNQEEIQAALRAMSAKENAPKEKSGGAMSKKVTAKVTEETAPEPPPKRTISKEESDRYVQMLNETAKRDAERSAAPKATPKEDIPISERTTDRDTTKELKAPTDYWELRKFVSDNQQRLAKLINDGKLREAKDLEQLIKSSNKKIDKMRFLKGAYISDEARRSKNAVGELFADLPTQTKPVKDVYSSRGALSETDVALNEVHYLRDRYRGDYLYGMSEHEANPTVFEADGKTYIRDNNQIVRVEEIRSLGELLTRGIRYGDTNPKLMGFVTSLIRKYASDVPVHVVSREDLNRLNPGADAYYHPAGYIVLPWELTQQDNEIYNRVVLHEGVHAALANRLNENPTAVAQIRLLAEYLKKEAGISRQDYMWTNAHEFLSEVLSRGDIQEALKNTPLTPELAKMLGVKEWREKSIWKALVERIAEWLGYRGPMNALEGVLSVVDRLERNDLSVNEETADGIFSFSAGTRIWPRPNELMSSRGALNLPTQEDVTSAVKDQSNATLNKIKRFGIKAATLDQLRQSTAGLFVDKNGNDMMEKLVSTVQRMAPFAQKLRDRSDQLAQQFLELKKSDPDMADRFADLALEATTANVRLGPGADNSHLGKGGRNAQGRGRLDDLQREFNSLSPEAKKLYADMAAYYRTMQNEHARGIVENRLQQYGVNPRDRQGFIDRVINGNTDKADENLFKDKGKAFERIKEISQLRVIQGDYFPMMRYGKFIVNTKNKINDLMGGTEIEPGKVEFRAATEKAARALAEAFAANVDLPQTNFQKSPTSQANDFGFIVSVQRNGAHFFENEAEAMKWRRENAKNFDEISEVSPIRETGKANSDLTTGQLNSLMATVKNSNYSDEEKEAMLDMLKQGSAVLMSGNRIQKRGIARRKVMGASNDFGRNVLQYGEAASSRLAQLKFRPAIDEALNEMREVNKNLMDKEAPKRTAVMNEVSARIDEGVTNVNEPGKFIKDLMSLTFLGKLASPMYSVVNAMQPWMVTLPVLSGRFGAVRAATVLQQAYSSLGFSENVMAGIANTYRAGKNFNATAFDTTDTVASIKKNLAKDKDGAELNALIDELLERGAMSSGGFELAQSISQGRSKYWGVPLAQVDRIARQLPQAIEDINRAATAVAAYRLARSSMTEEKARAFAFDTVMNTQGDYSNVNAPRVFNNPYLRPALQFKKYAQMMGYLLADMSHRAFAGADVETRREARKQLTAVMGVQIAMAGALSLPGIEIAKLGFMVAGALGLGGGWDDEEEKLRKLADDTFGKTWGELITRGVVSRALNIDLSQRLSLADMVTFGEPGDYERDGVDAYIARTLFGAPYSTITDIRKGVQEAVNGDFGKAAEHILPVKVIADAFKAANKYSEGKVTSVEAAMNVFGVKSGRQAEENRRIGSNIRNSEAIAAKHKELTNKYLAAKTAGERIKVRAQIVEFNKTAPLRQKVFPNSLEKMRHRIEMERVS